MITTENANALPLLSLDFAASRIPAAGVVRISKKKEKKKHLFMYTVYLGVDAWMDLRKSIPKHNEKNIFLEYYIFI